MATDFTIVARGYYLEGLAADAESGDAWYSDVTGGGIHHLPAGGGAAAYNNERLWTGGIVLNADGRVLSSGAEGIQWTDPATGRTGWLMDAMGVNEMAPDDRGGLYFGSVDLVSIMAGQKAAPARIYYLALDGSVTAVSGDLGFVNGMALSADGRTLFYNESFNATCRFDVQPDGSLANRTVLLDKYDADGMALDGEGNLWVTGFTSSHIERLSPEGALLEPVRTPAEAITQVRFGAGGEYWIAAVPRDAGADLAVGKLPEVERSFIYRGHSAVPGLPQRKSRFVI